MPDEQYDALRRLADESGRSMASIVRAAVDRHIREQAMAARHRTAEPTIPLFESGLPDLASRADE